jgi:hypothetical protein
VKFSDDTRRTCIQVRIGQSGRWNDGNGRNRYVSGLVCRSGLLRSIERHVKARGGIQGWTDAESIVSLMMLNLVGGECVADINRLESDKGFCQLLSKTLDHGLSRKGRRGLKNRWRKEKRRSVSSSSSVFRYLAEFHDRDQERLRGREWAEVCFVPNAIGHSKNGPEYRYLAIRERMQDQLMLPGMEQDEKKLPFQTMLRDRVKYKVFGIVTNMDWDGQELIEWHYKRCGRSEHAHSVMKEDLAGGTLPSGDFGENAAWWWIMILAFNLNAAFKSLVLGGKWVWKRMKAMRFSLINIPARVIGRSRQLSLRLNAGDPAYGWLVSIRAKIAALLPAPSG